VAHFTKAVGPAPQVFTLPIELRFFAGLPIEETADDSRARKVGAGVRARSLQSSLLAGLRRNGRSLPGPGQTIRTADRTKDLAGAISR
jgi:hypothetical protein